MDILLPRDPMIELEHHECSVILGCTYDVLIETTDRAYQQTAKYTVPGNYIQKLCKFYMQHAEICSKLTKSKL